MGATDKKNEEESPYMEILDKTKELAVMIKENEKYKNYRRSLKRLMERPELYRELNRFRRRNLELQVHETDDSYDVKMEELQRQYKNILMEASVIDFLTEEQTVCKMLREINDAFYKEIELDISYMDED